MRLEIPSLMGPTVAHDTRAWTIGRADPRETADYRALRREVFVAEQRVLDVDHDDLDAIESAPQPRMRVPQRSRDPCFLVVCGNDDREELGARRLIGK